jgi:hypothetical protein
VTFDKTDPDEPDYRTAPGKWFNSNPSLDIDFSDETMLQKVEYRLSNTDTWRTIEDDMDSATRTSNWSLDDDDWDNHIAERSSYYYLYFRITDKAGNVYETSDNGESFPLRKDSSVPNPPTYNTLPEGQIFTSNPPLDIDFSDALTLDKVKYQLDGTGGTWTTLRTGLSGNAYTTNWSMTSAIWTGLAPDSAHYIYFQIIDDAGNEYETGGVSAAYAFYKGSATGPITLGVESNNGDGSVQGDQAPAGDEGTLGEGANKNVVVVPVGDTPWYKSLPAEIIAILILIGSTIWWWIRRRGSSGGAGNLGSFMFTTLKTAASRVRMFLW